MTGFTTTDFDIIFGLPNDGINFECAATDVNIMATTKMRSNTIRVSLLSIFVQRRSPAPLY